jgi:hypothetical protein
VNYAIRDYVVLVIPDWFSLTLSFVTLGVVLASYWSRWRANRRWAGFADRLADANDAYARTDEALAPVQETLGRPAEAAEARARAAEYREGARSLREGNRRRGRQGLFRAALSASESPTPPARCGVPDSDPERLSGDLRAKTEPLDAER